MLGHPTPGRGGAAGARALSRIRTLGPHVHTITTAPEPLRARAYPSFVGHPTGPEAEGYTAAEGYNATLEGRGLRG